MYDFGLLITFLISITIFYFSIYFSLIKMIDDEKFYILNSRGPITKRYFNLLKYLKMLRIITLILILIVVFLYYLPRLLEYYS